MGHSEILIFVAIIATSQVSSVVISSPQITNWGTWGPWQYCPPGTFAESFQLNTEARLLVGDDTALNGIRLFCGDPKKPDTAVITSSVGQFGEWGKVYNCNPGVLDGFQLRVEPAQGSGDDTATNNARFFCSSNPTGFIEGDGLSFGEWSTAQHCFNNQGICGIRTQVEVTPDGAGENCKKMTNLNIKLEKLFCAIHNISKCEIFNYNNYNSY